MKFQLKAGGWLESITPSELKDAFREHEERRIRRELHVRREQRHVRPSEAGQTDGAGHVSVEVYRVPNGYELWLGRATVKLDGYTVNAPFSGGGFQVERDDNVVAVVPGPLPTSTPFAEGSQPRFLGGELLVVEVWGPAATSVVVLLEGRLRPV